MKIEGRLKRPEYAAVVAGAYRRGLDSLETGAFRKADAAGEKIVFSFRPDTVYTAEETGLFSAGGAEAEAGTDPEELFSGAALLHLALEEGYRLFAALPEQCGDRAKISALKKRVIGFGSAVDSVAGALGL